MAAERPSLLDVNLLVALFDPDHVHHDLAHDWFGDARVHGWATCPLTENGLIRILSNRRYSPLAEPPRQIAERLHAFCQSGGHRFWGDTISMGSPGVLAPSAAFSHQTVTDLYLLALARQHRGCLATFDRSIPVESIQGASRADLLVIEAVS
jgi:toxin-antitoxin system PIN domain toxin